MYATVSKIRSTLRLYAELPVIRVVAMSMVALVPLLREQRPHDIRCFAMVHYRGRGCVSRCALFAEP